MKYLLLFLFLPSLIKAQDRPDLRLKAFVGVSVAVYLEKDELFDASFSAGIQGGFGFRVTKKRLMTEIGFNFIRHTSSIEYFGIDPNLIDSSIDSFIQLNSFELPVNIGIATIKTPLVKHFLYGGITTHFTVKGIVNRRDIDEDIKIRPRNTKLYNPAFLMRLGTQLDIAFFNFDFNYSFGLNKSFKQVTRVQSHFIEFNIGVIF